MSENLKKVRELSLMVAVLASMVGHSGRFPDSCLPIICTFLRSNRNNVILYRIQYYVMEPTPGMLAAPP
jgi:hypothetical protein